MSKQKQTPKKKVSKKTETKKAVRKVAKKKVAKATTKKAKPAAKKAATKPKSKATKPKAKAEGEKLTKAQKQAAFVKEVLGEVKKGDKFELTEQKGKDYGLSDRKGTFRVLFYKNGKLIPRSTRQTDIKKARAVRDALYSYLEQEHKAKWRGNRASALIADAKADPDGMAGIYPQTIYRVNVGGKTITTTTNLDLAKTRRNKAIKTLGL